MNDKFLGTFFNFFIRLIAMIKLQVYLTKYEQTGFKSNDHTTACCVNLVHYKSTMVAKIFQHVNEILFGRSNSKLT